MFGSSRPLHITIFERTGSAGTGMPYHHGDNHEALLANIASVELSPLLVSLVDWLQSLSEIGLDSLGLEPEDMTERGFSACHARHLFQGPAFPTRREGHFGGSPR